MKNPELLTVKLGVVDTASKTKPCPEVKTYKTLNPAGIVASPFGVAEISNPIIGLAVNVPAFAVHTICDLTVVLKAKKTAIKIDSFQKLHENEFLMRYLFLMYATVLGIAFYSIYCNINLMLMNFDFQLKVI